MRPQKFLIFGRIFPRAVHASYNMVSYKTSMMNLINLCETIYGGTTAAQTPLKHFFHKQQYHSGEPRWR